MKTVTEPYSIMSPEFENSYGKDHPFKLYELSQIRAISRGNEQFVISLVKLFVEQTPDFVKQITEHYRSGNLEAMGEVAHKLKQSIFTMGIEDLKVSVVALVNAGRDKCHSESLPIHIQLLQCTTDMVIEELRKEFGL